MNESFWVCSKRVSNPTDADKWKVDVHKSNAEVWHSHTPNGTPCDLPKSEYHHCPAPVEWERVDSRTQVTVCFHQGDENIRAILDAKSGLRIGIIELVQPGYQIESVVVKRRKG